MAGDWIKWCKGLAKKPEVVAIASALGVSRHDVASRLMEVWEWCDDNIESKGLGQEETATVRMSSSDGDNCTFLDALVGLVGFADAMSDVGWLNVRTSRISFPKYARHNGDSAKSRARNSRNQKEKRRKKEHVSPENGDTSSLFSSTSSSVSERSEETKGEAADSPRARFTYPTVFETFYETYPANGRKGKKAAYERWKQARARLGKMGDENPVGTLQRQCEAYAASPKAHGEYGWNLTTWLNEGHYEDEPAAWQNRAQRDIFDPNGNLAAMNEYLRINREEKERNG